MSWQRLWSRLRSTQPRTRENRASPPAPRPTGPPSEAELLARLASDSALHSGLLEAVWQPMEQWLRQALRMLARQAGARPDARAYADAGYRALQESAFLLGDLLVAGTETPSFAGSMEGIEAYLAPYFPDAMERLFPRLLHEAEALHRRRASQSDAATRLSLVFQGAFTLN